MQFRQHLNTERMTQVEVHNVRKMTQDGVGKLQSTGVCLNFAQLIKAGFLRRQQIIGPAR